MHIRSKGIVASAVGGLLTVATRLGVVAQDDGAADDGSGLEVLGDAIATTVTDAVAAIAGGDEATDEGTTTTLDESFGLSIADATGGDTNFAFVS